MSYRLICGTVFLMGAAIMAAGCSDTRKVQVGAITFTSANGVEQTTQTALSAGLGTYFDVTIANDPALLGANWSVTCQSALPPGTPLPPGQTEDTSCGTFTPLHTMSAPVPSYATTGAGYVTFYTAPAAPPKGGTVTLYASSTANPSEYSTLTLNIQ